MGDADDADGVGLQQRLHEVHGGLRRAEHASVGRAPFDAGVVPLTLDCDVLSVAGSDLRIMVYTAEPDTEAADRLALLAVLGAQTPTS